MVTLSACDTGRGRVDLSEGVYGLVRAFQIAGSRHVLMTQWALNDPAARAFMEDFYARWLRPDADLHPAEALRATQLDWLDNADPVRAAPRYWAPYVLIERG
nr:CHAT domain-containing protein [Thiohalocapsa sp. ML1]